MAFSLKSIFPWLSESDEKAKTYPILKKGDKNEYVGIAQGQLASQGFYKGKIDNDFGAGTESAVAYFQQTHLNSKKQALNVTGTVNTDTWWALFNPLVLEKKQTSSSNKLIPSGLSSQRQKILEIAEKELIKTVKESPDGSNWGTDVKKYLQYCGLGPNPWCCAFVQWCSSFVFIPLPWKKTAHVATFWNIGKASGMSHTLNSGYKPKPGDFYIIIHGDNTGHIGIIVRVSKDSKTLNVIEGNSSNRVALRTRIVGQNSHVGYMNPFNDETAPYTFEYGLVGNTDNSGIDKTR